MKDLFRGFPFTVFNVQFELPWIIVLLVFLMTTANAVLWSALGIYEAVKEIVTWHVF